MERSIDREKVIKGLESLHSRLLDVAMKDSIIMLDVSMVANAIVLLKEQEAKWIEYPECLAYDGAYSDIHIVCSACKHVFSIIDNCTEEFDYCPHCGAKMEGR